MKKGTKETGAINLATLLVICLIFVVVLVGLIIAIKAFSGSSNNSSAKLDGDPKTIEDYKKIAKEYENFKKLVINYEGEEFVNNLLTFDFIYDIVDVNNNNYDDSNVKNFSEAEIKKSIEDFTNLKELYEYNVEELLISLDLTTQEKIEEYEDESNELFLDEFYVTDIEFEDFKNKMLNYMTEDVFVKEFTEYVKSLNGKLCFSDIAIGDADTIIESNIEKTDDNIYSVTVQMKSSYDVADYLDSDLDENTEDIEDVENQAEVNNTEEDIALEDVQDEIYEIMFDVKITSKDNKPIIAVFEY